MLIKEAESSGRSLGVMTEMRAGPVGRRHRRGDQTRAPPVCSDFPATPLRMCHLQKLQKRFRIPSVNRQRVSGVACSISRRWMLAPSWLPVWWPNPR